METLLGLFGFFVVYSVVHATVLQIHKKPWDLRTGYEQAITILAGTGVALIIIGLLLP